ncbi:uncharacterized protein LOC117180389 [Belonocnema kinseyi]|uniref:uncharacterized protein LOC117180389 n=1 Tax=Belonocnema kinseyi TaxID=2817044 RepID=UPI00143D11F7|nr:uncharacterized protein LOC117180389 [Belonocnema kinseyi]
MIRANTSSKSNKTLEKLDSDLDTPDETRFHVLMDFETKWYRVLFDTGAIHSYVGQNLLSIIKSNNYEIKTPDSDKLIVANGQGVSIIGQVLIPVRIGYVTKELLFRIVPKLTSKGIIGTDMLRKLGLQMDYEINHWCLPKLPEIRYAIKALPKANSKPIEKDLLNEKGSGKDMREIGTQTGWSNVERATRSNKDRKKKENENKERKEKKRKVITPDLKPKVFCYLDDIVIVSETFEEHVHYLNLVLDRLYEASLTISPEKCEFGCSEIKDLGFVVNGRALQIDEDKIKPILDFPQPLNRLLKKGKNWEWTEDQEKVMETIKKLLTTPSILACSDFRQPVQLEIDACDTGLGAVITQIIIEGNHYVIAYASRGLNEAERKYSASEKEYLAVVSEMAESLERQESLRREEEKGKLNMEEELDKAIKKNIEKMEKDLGTLRQEILE